MTPNPSTHSESQAKALADLSSLRRFTGTPAEFWPAFLASTGTLISASKAALILRDPAKPDAWKKLGDWSGASQSDRSIVAFNQSLVDIAERCASQGACIVPLDKSPAGDASAHAIAVRLPLNRPEEICIATFLLSNTGDTGAREAIVRLQLVADTPSSYLLNNAAQQAKLDVEKFAASLDILAVVNSEKRLISAALSLCNTLATRYQCDRVSLGWLEKGYIKLKTMSRTERFDKNMDAVKALEKMMEECLDQNDEILFPAPEGAGVVARDHEAFAKDQSSGNICSVPLRIGPDAVAVLTFERQSRPFTHAELQQFRLCCDQVVHRLADLHKSDRWFGARLAAATKTKAAVVLGPEKTWAKVLALLGVASIIVLFFIPFTYRVEGNFILRSDDVSFLTGPFDGYISEVNVRPGDQVKAADILLALDTQELLLEQSAASADFSRFLREAEKARATNDLAGMRIATALADQSRARLDMFKHRIEKASIRAPFEGVVVEGDLRERIGAPIKQGDALLKVARTDSLYAEAEVDQRAVHDIIGKTNAEIAFVSRPNLKFPATIERIEPAAFPKEGENVFMVRCQFPGGPLPEWWRPGMSGVVKIESGKRSLFWILTHETTDFLRMFFWW